MKLNLACGRRKLPDWVNIDISPEVNPDFIGNLLEFPWRWGTEKMADDTIEEIFCSHFIEHIGDEFIPFIDECYRVLKPGGMLHILSPYYTSVRCWQDPTHKRAITPVTFQYFSKAGRERLGVQHYPIKSDFDIKEQRLHMPEEMLGMPEDQRKDLLSHAWNTAADIEIFLVKHDPNEQSVDRQEDKVSLN